MKQNSNFIRVQAREAAREYWRARQNAREYAGSIYENPLLQEINFWHRQWKRLRLLAGIKRICAIVETDVYGAKAYHFRCLKCGQEGKRYDSKGWAVRESRFHNC